MESEKPTLAKNPFDRPDPPGTPTLEDWDVDRVDLKWTKPKNGKSLKILAFIVFDIFI